MAIRIRFDNSHNAIMPTFVLATRSGRKIGKLPAYNVVVKDCLNTYSEFTLKVNKEDCKANSGFWEQIVDFKLVWVKEWNTLFEIYVEVDESSDIEKVISAKSLGEAELSQINLYGIEINTEDDIARDDYEPTVLYDAFHPKASLLTRISEKIPHYTIGHVDSGIAKIQRTFSFDGKSIYDAFREIAEEINCIFIIKCRFDESDKLVREINVYDLEASCLDCGERGEFTVCPKCGSHNIYYGYGEDTNIFVSTTNLADNITYTTDNGAVKNCFKLEAGDDLMTATLINCNPNGSGYIWYISDMVKDDMSSALVEKLERYNQDYEYYQKEYPANVSGSILDSYNALVRKYKTYTDKYQEIASPIVGYPALMEAYYNTIDFYLYLNNTLMPTVEMAEATAKTEAAKLTASNLSPVAVKSLSSASVTTVDSSVLGMAKSLVNARFKVEVSDSSYSGSVWTGYFTVTNYANEEDTAKTGMVTLRVNDDYEAYVKQKIQKALAQKATKDDALDIKALFDLDEAAFKDELKKYSLQRLTAFHDCCQQCLDVLTEQGVGNGQTWDGQEKDLYKSLYLPYYNKLGYIEDEMAVRDGEIAVVVGVHDSNGRLTKSGFQTLLDDERDKIHDALNFEEYLGHDLWLEFAAYRREDTYSNTNYISDGLDNAELFDNARKFIEVAEKEIFKSATLQHSISATLKDLLVMKEFNPIVELFEVGNWIRIRVDDGIYRLRILDYEIDFDNLESIVVTFSDVAYVSDGISDANSVLDHAASMATSYDSTRRQARNGQDSKDTLGDWVQNGLDATNVRIMSNADNQNQTWDSHGMLFRAYDDVTQSFDDEQLKILNSTIAITDDKWKTVKTAVGGFYYLDPVTRQMKYAYGVNGEVLIGKLILGEQLGIYNDSGSLTFDRDGFVITNGRNSFKVNPNSENLLVLSNNTGDVLWVDSDGTLHIIGDGAGLDITTNDFINNMNTAITQNADAIRTEAQRAAEAEGQLSSSITQTADAIQAEVERATAEEGRLSSSITQTADAIKAEVERATEAEGKLNSSITQTAEEIRSEVERAKTAEGEISESVIKQTADMIQAEVERATAAEGKLSSSITQTAEAIETEVERATAAEGQLSSSIKQTADLIQTEVERASAAEGRLESSITQTAESIQSEVERATAAEGQLSSSITQTADSIKSEVERATAAEGLISSSITQTAEEIRSEITSTREGLSSEISQTAAGFTAQVEGLSGQFTLLEQTVDGFTFTDEGGKVWIDNGSLKLTGTITWEDLDDGAHQMIYSQHTSLPNYIKSTYIDHAQILSPTIKANVFEVHPSEENIYTGSFDIYGVAMLVGTGDEFHMLEIKYHGEDWGPYVTISSPGGAKIVFGDYYHQINHIGDIIFGADAVSADVNGAAHVSFVGNSTVDFSGATVTGLYLRFS